jgi:hypothetical protein
VRFTAEQTAQLLRPIAPTRVLKDADNHSHVSQQDITAHLTRVFGFGSFDTDLVSLDCVFEEPHIKDSKPVPGRFDVCYKAIMRLTVRDPAGQEVCHFEDGSTHTAQNQRRGAAHDLAMKSAISLAKKRTAINLGDQFGLSLYNKGQMTALVKGTLVYSAEDAAKETDGDVQDGVEQQVSLGNDEIDVGEPVHQPADPRAALWAEIRQAREARGWSTDDVAGDFAGWSEGLALGEADAGQLTRYVQHLRKQVTG